MSSTVPPRTDLPTHTPIDGCTGYINCKIFLCPYPEQNYELANC